MKKLILVCLFILFVGNANAVPGHFSCYYEDNYACCDETPLGWCPNIKDSKMVFKILRASEWEQFSSAGVFKGSIHDQRDGFIHLTSAKQLGPIIDKYFNDIPVYIVGFYPEQFGINLVWENEYPHLYNIPLKLQHVFRTFEYRE